MSDRAPYSRVYWSVMDDEKFQGIYEDDGAFACWVRLLMTADALWPQAPHLPSVKKRSLEMLVEAQIVDLLPHRRYRIRGLDNEREKRKALATTRGPDADRTVPGREPDGFEVQPPRRGEARSTETRQAESAREKPYEKAWREGGRKYPPTAGQQAIIDDYLLTFDKSGPERLARIFLENRKDPIGAALRDRDAFREERKAEYAAQEKEAAERRRGQRAPVELPRNAA